MELMLGSFHAHKMAPGIDFLGMSVCLVSFCERFDYFFRQSLNYLCKKCYLCHEGSVTMATFMIRIVYLDVKRLSSLLKLI